MPVKRCKTGDKEGRKWGDAGKCYPCKKKENGGWDCKQATQNALAQARAMGEIGELDKSDEELAEVIERGVEDNSAGFWKDAFYKTVSIEYKGVVLYGGE